MAAAAAAADDATLPAPAEAAVEAAAEAAAAAAEAVADAAAADDDPAAAEAAAAAPAHLWICRCSAETTVSVVHHIPQFGIQVETLPVETLCCPLRSDRMATECAPAATVAAALAPAAAEAAADAPAAEHSCSILSFSQGLRLDRVFLCCGIKLTTSRRNRLTRDLLSISEIRLSSVKY